MLVIAHPAAEKRRAVAEASVVTHMRAGVGLADYHGGMLEDFTNRLGIALGRDMDEAGFEIFFQGQIEKGIETVFALPLGDIFHGLALVLLIFANLT